LDYLKDYLPWVLSAITCYMTLMVGNKNKWSWALGLANQVLWVIWIVAASAWGLLPMTAVLTVLYARNHIRWLRDAKA
jgi:hypothetical protein